MNSEWAVPARGSEGLAPVAIGGQIDCKSNRTLLHGAPATCTCCNMAVMLCARPNQWWWPVISGKEGRLSPLASVPLVCIATRSLCRAVALGGQSRFGWPSALFTFVGFAKQFALAAERINSGLSRVQHLCASPIIVHRGTALLHQLADSSLACISLR